MCSSGHGMHGRNYAHVGPASGLQGHDIPVAGPARERPPNCQRTFSGKSGPPIPVHGVSLLPFRPVQGERNQALGRARYRGRKVPLLPDALRYGGIYRGITACMALEEMFHARRSRGQERRHALAPGATDICAVGEE